MDPIANSDLQPTTPLNIPSLTPDTLPGVISANNSLQNQVNTQNQITTNAQTNQNSQLNDLTNLQTMLGNQTSDTIAKQEELGLPQMNKDLSALQALQTQQTAQYLGGLNTIDSKNISNQARSSGEIALQRQHGIDSLITSSQIQAKQGNIDAAEITVKNAIDSKYAPILNQIEIKKTLLKDATDKASTERKAQLALQEKLIDKIGEFQKTALNNAILNNAPQDVLQSISRAGSIQDITKLGSKYIQSPVDKLDLQIKQAQLSKLNQELKTKNTDTGEIVKIGGKDYIRYKDGTISEPVLPDAADTGVVVSRLDEKLKTLGKLTTPSVGLATSAGSLRGAPIPFLAKGKINDWRADAVNIIQKLTVDELGRVKSDGVTFGALSNGERQAVGDAATALSAASIRDKDGNPTGRFRLSEKKVIEEFNKIKQGYELDFQKRTGIPYAEYINNPDAIKNKVADDFIDQSATALQNNSYYGNYTTN